MQRGYKPVAAVTGGGRGLHGEGAEVWWCWQNVSWRRRGGAAAHAGDDRLGLPHTGAAAGAAAEDDQFETVLPGIRTTAALTHASLTTRRPQPSALAHNETVNVRRTRGAFDPPRQLPLSHATLVCGSAPSEWMVHGRGFHHLATHGEGGRPSDESGQARPRSSTDVAMDLASGTVGQNRRQEEARNPKEQAIGCALLCLGSFCAPVDLLMQAHRCLALAAAFDPAHCFKRFAGDCKVIHVSHETDQRPTGRRADPPNTPYCVDRYTYTFIAMDSPAVNSTDADSWSTAEEENSVEDEVSRPMDTRCDGDNGFFANLFFDTLGQAPARFQEGAEVPCWQAAHGKTKDDLLEFYHVDYTFYYLDKLNYACPVVGDDCFTIIDPAEEFDEFNDNCGSLATSGWLVLSLVFCKPGLDCRAVYYGATKPPASVRNRWLKFVVL